MRLLRALAASAALTRPMSPGLSSTSRISGVQFMITVLLMGRSYGQSESESRTGPNLGLDPNPAAMLFNDFLANGQSHTVAGIFLPGVQPLEDDEYRLQVLRRNADDVIGYGERY